MRDYSRFGLVSLRDECDEKGIKWSPKDTAEALRKKLSPKPKEAKKPAK